MPPNQREYTVRRGDTLAGIARDQFGGASLADLTGFRSGDPNLIYPGEVISLRGSSSTPSLPDIPGAAAAQAGALAGYTGRQAPPTPSAQGATRIDDELVGRASQFINQNQSRDTTLADPNTPPIRGQNQGGTANSFIEAFREIFGTGQAPAVPSFRELYEEQREEFDIPGLQETINAYDQQERLILESVQRGIETAEGRPVDESVAQGDIRRLTTEEQRQLTTIGRLKADAVNRLNNANSAIETLIKYTSMDYTNAAQQYQSQISQFINLANLVGNQQNREQTRAAANASFIYNAVKDGNLTLDQADPSTVAQLNQLSTQIGLPTNFFQNLSRQQPNNKVLSITTRVTGGVKYLDEFSQNPTTGEKILQSYRVGASGSNDDNREPIISLEDYIAEAQTFNSERLQQSIVLQPGSDEYNAYAGKWYTKYYLPTKQEPFTSDQLKRLEQAGLQLADRQEQLDFLYERTDGALEDRFATEGVN